MEPEVGRTPVQEAKKLGELLDDLLEKWHFHYLPNRSLILDEDDKWDSKYLKNKNLDHFQAFSNKSLSSSLVTIFETVNKQLTALFDHLAQCQELFLKIASGIVPFQ